MHCKGVFLHQLCLPRPRWAAIHQLRLIPATLGGDSSAVPYPGHAGRRFIRQFALPLKITSFIIIGTLICKCAHAILSSFAGILLIN
jgi:hypothetical protein